MFSKLFLSKFGWVVEKYWNGKWDKNKIIYKAQGEISRDVRNLICTKSYILDPIADMFKALPSNDEKALAVLKYVKNRSTYSGDVNTHKVPEYWQHPEETFQTKTGDCEDGSLLIISLMRMAGVPAFRIKLCAGWVKTKDGQGGHAYPIYLSEAKNDWFVLDWCYYYSDSVASFNVTPHRLKENYQEIWWTANDEFTWAQKSTVISFNKEVKL